MGLNDSYYRIDFREQTRQVQIYDYLVFVCGEDVTAYTKSIEVTFTNRTGPGSATIIFANPFDQWLITKANLKNHWRKAKDRYSELPKFNIYNKKLKLSKKQNTPPSKDAGNNSTKVKTTPLDNVEEQTSPEEYQDFLQRYSFGPGTCIFSKLDPVKIYMRNPYNDPDVTDYWMPWFTGTVDSKPFTTDFITGDSSITLNCFDLRAAMQAMRVAVNPYKNNLLTATQSPGTGIQGSLDNEIILGADSPYFKDYLPTQKDSVSDHLSNIYAGKPFVDAVSLLITGKTGWVNKEGTNNPVVQGEGIGSFTPGEVYRYRNPESPVKGTANIQVIDLTQWDLLCLFGSKKRFWTLQECINEGKDSFFDGKSHPFIGKLHWLLPSENLNVASLLQSTAVGPGDIMGTPDWTDRYSLLTQMCNLVDYEFTITAPGDIVLEFPMYDINPKNFKHSPVYQTEMHVRSESISDEGGEILSGLQASSLSSQQGTQEQQSQINEIQTQAAQQAKVDDFRVLVFSNVLAAKYGAKIQSVSFTGASTPQALLKLAIVEFQKRLAEANKLSLTMEFRPYLRPNRPFLYAEQNRLRLGKINTVSYNMAVFEAPTMNLSLGCVRLPLQQGGDTVFQHITGGETFAMSYNQVLETPNVGIYAQTIKTPKGTSK